MRYALLLFLSTFILMGAQTKKPEMSVNQLNSAAIHQIELENYDSAIVLLNNLIDIQPDFPDAYYNRGGCKQYTGNHRGAIFDFDHAIKIAPKDPDSYYNRGLSKFELRAFRGAMQDFSKAIKIDPGYAEAYYDRAFCEKELKLFDQACKDFRIAYERGIKSSKKQYKTVCKK